MKNGKRIICAGSGNNTNDAYFRASANGELTCTSNGFVSINDPSIYN